jgi:UDP-glucose 4-epimerase
VTSTTRGLRTPARAARDSKAVAGQAAPGSIRRALVTGGAGFIGSHLADRLVDDGISLLVIDDLSTGKADRLDPAVRLEVVDVATGDLDAIMGGWRPDVVFHLAAQASVPASMADPLRDLAVNVVGTHRVARAAREAGVARLVFVSSGGAIYGDAQRAATERTPPAPTSYYGAHKLAAEHHVRLGGVSWAIARPSNVFGPRQTAGVDGAVVAAFVNQALAEGRLHIHGDGSQTRDFVHVRDAVDALIRLADPDLAPGIWNVATGRSMRIDELATAVEYALKRPLARIHEPRRPGDVMRSALSAARLRALGWRPRQTVREGIRELLEALVSS